jgi:hypothetical protein
MSRVRAWQQEEHGVAIVYVLVVLLIALAFGVAGLTEALSSRNFAGRDTRLARAQQAADAGIQAVLYQQSEKDLGSTAYNFNGGSLGLSTLTDCTVPQLNASGQVTGLVTVAANSAGVCPLAIGSGGGSSPFAPSLGDHTTYQAEMITGQTDLLSGTAFGSQNGTPIIELFPKIVSIGSESSATGGSSTPVYAREEAILAPWAPLQAIEGQHNVTLNGLSTCLTLLGCGSLTGTLNGDVLAAHNLALPSTLAGLNLSNGLVAALLYGAACSPATPCGLYAHQVSTSNLVSRTPVQISASKASCPTTDSGCASLGSSYNSSADTFSMSSGTVTFSSGDYVFCSFSATGGTLKFNPSSSSPVRIFIDSPSSSRCSHDTGDSLKGDFYDPIGFTNGLLSTSGVLGSSGVQIYLAGDGSADDNTSVQLGPTSTSSLYSGTTASTYGAIVYAPYSQVTVNVPGTCTKLLASACTGGVAEGAFIGYDTTVTALTISQDLSISNFPLYAGVNAYRPQQYVQCDASVSSLSGSTSDLNGC